MIHGAGGLVKTSRLTNCQLEINSLVPCDSLISLKKTEGVSINKGYDGVGGGGGKTGTGRRGTECHLNHEGRLSLYKHTEEYQGMINPLWLLLLFYFGGGWVGWLVF